MSGVASRSSSLTFLTHQSRYTRLPSAVYSWTAPHLAPPTLGIINRRSESYWVLARTQYDSDRRLIIPKVGGARWGAVQEYTADGNLVYRDWWVRNVKLEDLEATPDTNIKVLKDPNSNIQPPVLGLGGDNLQENANENTVIIGTEPTDTDLSEPNEVDPFAPVTTPVPATGSDEVDPFAPVPVAPNESDPFAPPMESTEDAGIPEPDPFAPLPSPF